MSACFPFFNCHQGRGPSEWTHNSRHRIRDRALAGTFTGGRSGRMGTGTGPHWSGLDWMCAFWELIAEQTERTRETFCCFGGSWSRGGLAATLLDVCACVCVSWLLHDYLSILSLSLSGSLFFPLLVGSWSSIVMVLESVFHWTALMLRFLLYIGFIVRRTSRSAGSSEDGRGRDRSLDWDHTGLSAPGLSHHLYACNFVALLAT